MSDDVEDRLSRLENAMTVILLITIGPLAAVGAVWFIDRIMGRNGEAAE